MKEELRNNYPREYEEDYFLQSLGERIYNIRKARGETQLSLALKCQTAKSYICELEAGKRNPSVKVLFRIAKALEVGLEDFFVDLDEF